MTRWNVIILLAQGWSAKRAERVHRMDKKLAISIAGNTSSQYILAVAALPVCLMEETTGAALSASDRVRPA
jgi:hypothetical protein